MQTLASRRSSGLSPQSRRIAVFAVLLFALAGLISGFTVGAFVRPKIGLPGSNGGNTNPGIVQQTKTTTPVAQPRPQTIRFEAVDNYEPREISNGTTYTLTAHLKPVLDANGQPVRATNLTCKLWLISRVPGDQGVYVPPDIARNVAGISQTFTIEGATLPDLNPMPDVTYQEIPGSLTFTGGTRQTEPCATQGKVTWRYQISPSVPSGKYTLAGLYDWSGVHWTYFWVDITIKQANSN